MQSRTVRYMLWNMALRPLLLWCVMGSVWGQGVTFDRILHADREPQNWLTYSGTVNGQRYSPLTQITPANVKNLELQWVWQAKSTEKFETTALVVDGVLYTIEAPERRVRAGRRHRPDLLEPHLHAGAGGARLLRARESRPRHSGRHAVHGNARRAPDRDRRQEREDSLEHDGRRRRPTATPSRTRR